MHNSNKTIWIVNFHTAPPDFALNPRYISLIKYLKDYGYNIIVFSSSYLRRFDRDLIQEKKTYIEVEYNGIKFVHIKSPKYKNNGLTRMLSIMQFSFRFRSIVNKFDKPDIIYHNLHVPFDVPVYFGAKKLKVKYIAAVWDLWPEFFHIVGLVKKNNPLLKIAYIIERWIYKKSDAIVFTMKGAVDYIKLKRWDLASGGNIDLNKTHYITNGIDLSEFNENKFNFETKDEILDNNSLFKIVYVGTFNKANNIKQVLDAANVLKSDKSIVFLLYGDGGQREELEVYCQENNIYNVIFKEKYIPFKMLPSILSKCSLAVMNYQKEFGLYGVSPGKLPLYLASGKPIISNVKVSHCVIEEKKLGISKDITSSDEYAKAILQIKNLPSHEYEELCDRVNRVAKEYDYKYLAEKLHKVFSNTSNIK